MLIGEITLMHHNAESVKVAFDVARTHDVRDALDIMKEYQADSDGDKAVNAMKEISKE